MQLSSMKAYTPPNFGQDPSLHFITQRYAMLTTSLLLLNADYQVSHTLCWIFLPLKTDWCTWMLKWVQCGVQLVSCGGGLCTGWADGSQHRPAALCCNGGAAAPVEALCTQAPGHHLRHHQLPPHRAGGHMLLALGQFSCTLKEVVRLSTDGRRCYKSA